MGIPRRLWALWAERPGFVLLAAVTVATLLVWPAVDVLLRGAGVGIPFGFNDYGAYAGAVARWLEGGSLYVRDEGGGFHGSYLYPPVTVVLFYPFRFFDFTTAAALLGGLSLVLLWVGLAAVVRTLGDGLGVGERLLLLGLLVGFYPALRAFKWAQLSTLLTALLCFACYAQELGERERDGTRRHRVGAGALTTLASAYKLFFATAGAHLLRDRDRFAGALATAGLLVGLSVALFGVETHLTYLEVLAWGKGWGPTRGPGLWDASAAYRPLAVAGAMALPLRALGVVAVAGVTRATRHAEGASARRLAFALGVAAIPLLAPRADTHDLVVLVLPAVLLLSEELRRPAGLPAVPVLSVLLVHLHRYVVAVLIETPDWLPAGAVLTSLAPWLQPGAWGTYLLVGLAAYRLADHARWPRGRGGRPA